MQGSNGDGISEATRRMVARTRVRSATPPGQLADLPATPAPEMTPEQIRTLTGDTIAKAQQASYLLGKLAVLLGENRA